MSSSLPPLTLLLGPARSGKTTWCLRRMQEAKGRAILLTPGHERFVLERAATMGIGREIVEGAVFVSGKLVDLMLQGHPSRATSAGPTVQRMAVELAIETAVPADGYFAGVRDVRGFVDAVRDAIREMKRDALTPGGLRDAAEASATEIDDPEFQRRCGETAAIWEAYEDLLRENGWRDEEDGILLAAERVRKGEANIPRDARVVLVDGRRRFEPIWRDLIAALAGTGIEVVVTLPYEADRDLLFAAPQRELDKLRREFTTREIVLSPDLPQQVPEGLLALERGLFSSGSPQTALPGDPRESAILVFDAPNPYAEAEMAARALSREHERGTPWARCAILLRSAENYRALLEGICSERYGIPMALTSARPLAGMPAVATVLGLIRIIADGWRRDDLIAYLKSSLTGGDKLEADLLLRRSKRRGVREGMVAWLELARAELSASSPTLDLLESLVDCTRDAHRRTRTVDAVVAWLNGMIRELGSASGPEEHEAPELQQMRAVLTEVALAAGMQESSPLPFAEASRPIVIALELSLYTPSAPDDAVAVLAPDDIPDRRLDFAIVMGLTERVFPRRAAEDPFLRDDERAILSRVADLDLECRMGRSDDERLLFYLAATAPVSRLVLSFPRSDEESDTLPSFYIDEVRALFGHVPTVVRTLADVAPTPDECVSDHDEVLAACSSGATASLPPASEIAASVDLPHRPAILGRANRKDLARRRRYGVSELETYRTCPFRHFAQQALGLRAEEDGANAADEGSLYHTVLARYFRDALENDRQDTEETMRDRLVRELRLALASRAIDAAPYRLRMLGRRLADSLAGFALREVRYRRQFGMAPAHFELSFGQHEAGECDDPPAERGLGREYDRASVVRTLEVASADGADAVEVSGVVDRVDMAADGSALVMDYKLGHTPDYTAMRDGRSLQLPLYMHAVEELWQWTAAAGCYDSPRDAGRKRLFRTEHTDLRKFGPIPGVEQGSVAKPVSPDQYRELIATALSAVREAARGIRDGEIVPTPGNHCRWCDFGDICRTSITGEHDGEPLTTS